MAIPEEPTIVVRALMAEYVRTQGKLEGAYKRLDFAQRSAAAEEAIIAECVVDMLKLTEALTPLGVDPNKTASDPARASDA